MKRVLVLANNPAQASFRLRIAALAPLLAERGFEWEICIRPKGWLAGSELRRILRNAGTYHAVLLQRRFLDPLDAGVLHRHARKIFYDIDDALMFHNRQVGRISRWRTGRRFRATARILDHVVAGNEYLAQIFRDQGRRVSIIPTMLDAGRYQIKTHGPTPTPRLVWIGSHSTIPYVRQFLPAFDEAAKTVPGLRLLTIADATVQSATLPVEHEPWSEQTEAAALCRGDIGIAPTPADEWTLGKCGFKILQYMAAGLPIIASPVGANAQIVRDGMTGFLPKDAMAWPAAITRLAGDAELRGRMGRAAREDVQASYSLARAADDWANLLAE
ncbi:MAG TPA: glycosyltransferase family 4 protein [Tepidisphaeraceae bacterium]